MLEHAKEEMGPEAWDKFKDPLPFNVEDLFTRAAARMVEGPPGATDDELQALKDSATGDDQ